MVGFLKVIFYHLVSDSGRPHVRHLYRYKSRRQFAADLEYLRRNHTVLSHGEFAGHLAARTPFPPGSVMITFDDGFSECFSVIRPLLLEFGLPAVFFVPSGVIDNRHLPFRNLVSLCLGKVKRAGRDELRALSRRLEVLTGRKPTGRKALLKRLEALTPAEAPVLEAASSALEIDAEKYLEERRPYLTEAEVRALARDGFVIGGHGREHAPLDRLGDDELEEEILSSCGRIREITGQELVPFAFPFSGLELDPARAAGILDRHPFISAVFGARPLPGDRRVIPRRIWADSPAGAGIRRSNLPRLFENPPDGG